jgi:hypothetical protein
MTKQMTPQEMMEAFALMQSAMAKIGAQLLKDATVGDVHVATSGKGKKPAPVVGGKEPGDKEPDDDPDDKGGDHRPVAGGDLAKFDLHFTITKAEPDQQRVWGWASVSQIGDYVVIDKQGDIIPIAELEKAAYDFILHSRAQGDMHSKFDVGRSIESMVFTPEKEAAGIMAKDENGKSIFGWWIGFQVDDPAVWADYRKGIRPEFSIGGRSGWEGDGSA